MTKCPGCQQEIVVTTDDRGFMIECGGEGEGSCEAAWDDSNPALLEEIGEAQKQAIYKRDIGS